MTKYLLSINWKYKWKK